MSKTVSEITPALADFIRAQPMFFVATAPLSAEGHLNLSPKGLDTFTVLSPRSVAYLDLTGSGIETIAHLRENRRIVVMFCAFEGPANIVRLHGRGEWVEPGREEFAALLGNFPRTFRGAAGPAVRGVIRIAVDRVSTSCGFGVPLMRREGQRKTLLNWARRQGPEGMKAYRRKKNAQSIDGLPGIPADA